MSVYEVNKVMWHIDGDDAALEAFAADSAAFLDAWEAAATDPRPPHPVGGRFTTEERAALEAWDYERLYAMGAHPFILWQLMRALYVPNVMSGSELIEAFREAVTPHGYPDFGTTRIAGS